jgi:putative aldouronate transport system substrate-binding protein
MKRKLSLILALLLILALFAGCGGNGQINTANDNKGTPTDSGKNTNATPKVESTQQPEEVEEDSPYNFAVGKYEVNEEGWPVAKYEYELPLSTTGEKFTHWTICWTPQYLPEDGYDGLSMYAGMQEMTGVDIEYFLVSAATRSENFATLVNSDSLLDIMSQGSYYWTSGTIQQAVDDGYFANFYQYREYLPNYLAEIYSRSLTDTTIMDTVFYKENVWVTMYGLFETPIQNTGYMLRQDIMDELGLGSAHDVKTYDQVYEILKAFKAAKGPDFYPMMVFSSMELAAYNWCGFNTTAANGSLAYTRVVDGEVQFCGTTSDDRALLTMLNSWWNEGLIDPNWSSYSYTANLANAITNDLLGYIIFTPSEVAAYEQTCINPKCQFEPTQRLRITEDQIIHWGYAGGSTNYGSAVFSAKCSNMPLLMTFMDWQYSDSGSDWTNWGPEGELWEYDEKGNRMLTEFALTHEAGTAWLQDCFCYNELGDAGIQHWRRNYAYPGGDRFVAMFDTWDVSGFFDSAWTFPRGVKFEDEQQEIIDQYRTDPNTYFAENAPLFFTGDRPLSEWDSYVQSLMDMGLAKVIEVYQEGYDEYMAKKAG